MQNTLASILDEVRRAWPFRWIGLITAAVVAVVASLTTLLLPDLYASSVEIAVLRSGDQAILPVHNAELRFINDKTLDTIIDNVDFGIDRESAGARQRAKQAIRSRITLVGADTELFVINYLDTNPSRAQTVARILLAEFGNAVRENADTASLKQTLADQQLLLAAAEKRLQEYRADHLDVFGQGGIEARLDAARGTAEKAAAEYDAAARRRDQFQAVWRESLAGGVAGAPAGLAPPSGDPLIDRLYVAYAELETLRTRYSENHPDVVLARRQIETIVRQYPPGERMCVRGAPDAPANTASLEEDSLAINRALVDAVGSNIAVCRAYAALVQAEREVDTLAAIGASAPPVQAEFSRLVSERDILRERVENLRRRIQDMDAGDPTALFTVVAGPDLPRAPSSPNRRLLLGLALLGALVGGGGGAYVRGMIASTFVSPSEIRRIYALPFYGAVSLTNGLRSGVERSTQLVTFLAVLGALIGGMLLLILVDPYISIARQWTVGIAMPLLKMWGFGQ